jgi:hypothetical protein
MNIYFSCSITGGRQDQGVYQALVEALLADGHEVPTAHLSSADVMDLEAVINPREVYARDKAWVLGCDAMVAEVSTPSHGVGYEIALALVAGKPVICCWRQGKPVSKMITGNSSPSLKLAAYSEAEELIARVRSFLAEALVR